MGIGKDIFGNLFGTNVLGKANDNNAQGERPKDIFGNPLKDFYGKDTGEEEEETEE